MINVMIVEDEKLSSRQVKNELIRIGIDKNNICEASNGIMALEMAEKFRPDILLTDINMPRMLGTELAQKIIALYPRCKVIFFSGYSDKEYLKTAIKLNVVDYLEKPLDTEELKFAVDKAVGMIKQDRQSVSASRSDEERTNKLIETLLKKKAITDEMLNEAGLKRHSVIRGIMVIIVPCGEHHNFVADILIEKSEKHSIKLLYRYAKRGVIELLFIDDEKSSIKNKVEKIMTEFFSGLSEDDIFKCGVGTVEHGYSNIYASYENAVCAIDRAFFFKPNKIVYYSPVNEKNEFDISDILQKFNEALEENSFEAARWMIKDINTQLCLNTSLMSSYAKNIYYKLFEVINTFIKKHFIIYNKEYDIYNMLSNIMETQFLSDLHEQMMTELKKLEVLVEKTNFNGTVRSAILYIEKNLSDPNISILDIAQYCNVSANYLCGQFKAVTGKTINNYVNNLRISEAKKLILETNKNINEISSLCGFNDAKYFCKVFNKYTDMTPTKFRSKYR